MKWGIWSGLDNSPGSSAGKSLDLSHLNCSIFRTPSCPSITTHSQRQPLRPGLRYMAWHWTGAPKERPLSSQSENWSKLGAAESLKLIYGPASRDEDERNQGPTQTQLSSGMQRKCAKENDTKVLMVRVPGQHKFRQSQLLVKSRSPLARGMYSPLSELYNPVCHSRTPTTAVHYPHSTQPITKRQPCFWGEQFGKSLRFH